MTPTNGCWERSKSRPWLWLLATPLIGVLLACGGAGSVNQQERDRDKAIEDARVKAASEKDPKRKAELEAAAAKLEQEQKLEREARAKEEREEKRNARRAVLAVSATALIDEYKANEVAADQRYKGKWIEVTGVVDHVRSGLLDDYLILKSDREFEFRSVQCFFPNHNLADVKPRYIYTLRGRCDGMFGNIGLKDCEFGTQAEADAHENAARAEEARKQREQEETVRREELRKQREREIAERDAAEARDPTLKAARLKREREAEAAKRKAVAEAEAAKKKSEAERIERERAAAEAAAKAKEEERAAQKLRLAKRYLDEADEEAERAKKIEIGREEAKDRADLLRKRGIQRLQIIVKDYPDTAAGREAAKLLKTVK